MDHGTDLRREVSDGLQSRVVKKMKTTSWGYLVVEKLSSLPDRERPVVTGHHVTTSVANRKTDLRHPQVIGQQQTHSLTYSVLTSSLTYSLTYLTYLLTYLVMSFYTSSQRLVYPGCVVRSLVVTTGSESLRLWVV